LFAALDEEAERVRATYAENYGHLAAVKAKYETGNCFNVNQHIDPAAGDTRQSGTTSKSVQNTNSENSR
jgi:hypothetical protein